MPPAVAARLEALGHQVAQRDTISAAQPVAVEDGKLGPSTTRACRQRCRGTGAFTELVSEAGRDVSAATARGRASRGRNARATRAR